MRLGDELAIIAAEAAAAGRLRSDRPPAHLARGARIDRAERRADPGRPRPWRWPAGCSPAPRRCAGSSCSPTAVSTEPPTWPARTDVELIVLGTKTGNVGITRLQARRSLLDPIGYEILVEVANASDEPVSCRLELDLEDDPIDVVPLTLAPGERNVQVFEKTSADGGRLRRTIDRADALPADNTAWAILPRRVAPEGDAGHAGQPLPREGVRGDPAGRPGVVKVDRTASRPAPSAGGAGRCRSWSFIARFPTRLPAGHVLVIEPSAPGRSGSWARCFTTRSSPSRTKTRR